MLSVVLLVSHFIFLLLGAIFVGASFAGFVNSQFGAETSACLVIVSWMGFAGFTITKAVRPAYRLATGNGESNEALWWAKRLFAAATALGPLTGIGLAFLAFVGCGPLWLPKLYHWGGMIVTALAFAGFFFLPALVRACVGVTDEYAKFRNLGWLVHPSLVLLAWILVWLGPYLKLRDNVNLSDYPISSENIGTSSGGLTRKVASGNSGKKSGPGSPTPRGPSPTTPNTCFHFRAAKQVG